MPLTHSAFMSSLVNRLWSPRPKISSISPGVRISEHCQRPNKDVFSGMGNKEEDFLRVMFNPQSKLKCKIKSWYACCDQL